MFNFTILANVASQRSGARTTYYLERLARGFATDVNGKPTVINSDNTLGADIGVFGGQILKENERLLDNDVLLVVRTPTLAIFDAQAVMRQKNDHVKMVIRHVVLIDPQTGRLYTLVWLLDRDYKAAEAALQALPNSMREARYLSVKRDKFNFAGIPTPEAIALGRIPQGTAVAYTDRLKVAATLKTFTEQDVPRVEQILRETAQQASAK
jgi:hypothetical protein